MRGEVDDTLEPEAALRIARFLQVDAGFLFAARLSPDPEQFIQRQIEVPAPHSDTLAPSRDLQVPHAASVHRAHESKEGRDIEGRQR
jgi:hypothetical protein